MTARFVREKSLLDQILSMGGGQFTAESRGAAVHIRQRCYQFRKAQRDEPDANPRYELITIQQTDNRLVFKVAEPLPGTLTGPNGETVTLPAPKAIPTRKLQLSDELEEAAANVIGELGLEIVEGDDE